MDIAELKGQLHRIATLQDKEKAIACRELLVQAVQYVYAKKQVKFPVNASLIELLESEDFCSYIDSSDMVASLHYIRILGKNAENNKNPKKTECKLAYQNITNLIDLLEKKEAGNTQIDTSQYLSEAETRHLYVDLYLQEAGWEVLEKKDVVAPAKAGIEIEVHGMPNAHDTGYCDYVLYGRDGKPLAIVEVKRTTISAERGRHQVNLYADCMEKKYGYRPVLYYTNGYITKVIDGSYPDREVMTFHTLEELDLMIKRRGKEDILDITINNDITGRPYQRIAITKLCELFNQRKRRGLLVMATGTGKTRVAISLTDILIRNNKVKNVLFLADRTALVHQAKKEFEKHLPSMSVCELSGNDKDKDMTARLMFCTYQTMINYIDAEDKEFTAGRFDLIIIDEAHRSIFNRYGSIFRYFDSLLVGLTATPKNEVSANTYKIFNCEAGVPTDDYPMERAIKEKYLVGYEVLNRSSKIMDDGIKWNDLTAEEQEELIDYEDELFEEDGELKLPNKLIYKKLFNKDTCKRVLEELMINGLYIDGGETIGKTIIFAYNHRHAQMIVDCFHEVYPMYDANMCQLVDYSVNYADNLVDQFKMDDKFRIAVSVDMLDTGVDVPEILNLVFFKRVRSKIKFVQMLGRGTRLCENLYGQGKNKSKFLVFDYCNNFEYFSQQYADHEGEEKPSTSQRVYAVRLELLQLLQSEEYQSQVWFKDFYEATKKDLLNVVVNLKQDSKRIQVRQELEYVDKYQKPASWVALSQNDCKNIVRHIIPLLERGISGDYKAVSFDLRMYNIMLSLLQCGNCNKAFVDVKRVREIAQYLLKTKASIPQVHALASQLKILRDEQFWDKASVKDIEENRIVIRELMKFVGQSGPEALNIDVEDEIGNAGFVVSGTAIDIRTYKEKVMDYLMEHLDCDVINKIHNLEPITTDDLQKLEVVLWQKLGTKEDYIEATDVGNLAVFVRSIVGLDQECVNEKFSEYLSGTMLNSMQQEFIREIIDYVQVNGDIQVDDIINKEPFNDHDISELFDDSIPVIKMVIERLHQPIEVVNT